MPYEIEKGVPVTAIGRAGRQRKFPYDIMEVGDSFFVAGQDPRDTRRAGAASRFYSPKKFTCRKETKDGVRGYRIWRIA